MELSSKKIILIISITIIVTAAISICITYFSLVNTVLENCNPHIAGKAVFQFHMYDFDGVSPSGSSSYVQINPYSFCNNLFR